jgi:hypothetical protein
VKVFFDNCTSPVFASTLHGFILHDGHAAYHIRDVPGLESGRHATDLQWIEHLRQAREPWLFISGDRRILTNPAERGTKVGGPSWVRSRAFVPEDTLA